MKELSYNLPAYVLKGWLAVAFAAIFLFGATGQMMALCLPLAYAYAVLFLLDWKQAYWLLLLLLPVSVQVGFAGNTLSLTLPAEPMMWLFLLLSCLIFLMQPSALLLRWWRHPVVVIVLLQLVWLAIAVIYSESPFLSLKFLLAKIWMLACFFVLPVWIFKDKRDFRTAFLVLLVPIVFSVLVVLYRHAGMHFLFSRANHAVGRLYVNHVDYAAVLSQFFPAVVAGCWLAESKRSKSILACCAILLLLAVYFSYARAGMLAIVFSCFMALMLRVRLLRWVMPAGYLLIAVLVWYMAKTEHYAVLRPRYEQTVYHTTFDSHMLATFEGHDASSMERLYRWTAALRMSRERPLTGFGPNAFYSHYRPYALPTFRTYSSINEEHSTTHNYFLYMLAEQGYPGMLLYALLMAVVFARCQHLYYRLLDPVYKKYCVALMMMTAACFVNNFFSELLETPKIGALFYLGLALLVLLDMRAGRGVSRSAGPP